MSRSSGGRVIIKKFTADKINKQKTKGKEKKVKSNIVPGGR